MRKKEADEGEGNSGITHDRSRTAKVPLGSSEAQLISANAEGNVSGGTKSPSCAVHFRR